MKALEWLKAKKEKTDKRIRKNSYLLAVIDRREIKREEKLRNQDTPFYKDKLDCKFF